MNALDFIIIAILVVTIVYSCIRGFIKEAFSIGAIIVGIIIACQYYLNLSDYLSSIIENQSAANIVSFLLLFIIVSIIISLIGKLIRRFIKVIHLGWLDRQIGILFGFIKGIVIAAILVIILTAALPSSSSIIVDSKIIPYIIPVTRVITIIVPKNLKDLFRKKQENVREFLEEKKEPSKSSPESSETNAPPLRGKK